MARIKNSFFSSEFSSLMNKVSLTQSYQTEKAIIDALLKISEIVKKTETNRPHQKWNHTNKCSKKIVGDGDYNDFYVDHEQQEVPMPPPMRTLDSYVSGLNQRSTQKSSNCNQASITKQSDPSSENQHLVSKNAKVQGHSYKRLCSDSSSTSSLLNDHRKKFSRHHSNHRSNNNLQMKTENPLTTNNTAIERQSSINSTPVCIDQKQVSSSVDLVTNREADFDRELQITLEKYLKNHLLSSTKTTTENIQQQRKIRLSSLTKSETEKLIHQFNFPKPISSLKHYEKQRELAMLAAKQGNYSLSYSIYTNLLHDPQYDDYKLKSDILASRATTLLLEQKCFESIDDCTQAVAFNQWNKLAYVVRAACWMIKQEYIKAVEDYSKLFHFFDQSQYVLDLLNLAYEKLKSTDDDKKSIASFIQPAVYLCYPYQTWYRTNNEQDEGIIH